MGPFVKPLVILLSLLWAGLAWANDVQRQIVVSGEGRVQAVPDMAVITLGVTSDSPNAQSAMDATSAQMREIFDALSTLGIAPQDARTATLRLDPIFSNRAQAGQGAPEIRGFVAINDVTVTIRDIDQLGTTLQALIEAGANRVTSIRFALSEPGLAREAARLEAIADAQARAALYAEAAGVSLGPVLSIVERGASVPGPVFGARMAMEASVPVVGGALDVTAGVTITYGIAE